MAIGILSVLGLLKKVPKLIKAVTGGNGGLKDKAIALAKSITGTNNEDDAVAALHADPELRYKYELALLADKHIPDRLNLENTKDARVMYKDTDHKQTDKIAESVMHNNLWMVAVALIVLVGVVNYVEDGALVAVISSVVGGVINGLMSERRDVINFHFGSSMGSKSKDKK